MISINVNRIQVKKFHQLMGRLSAFFWWAAILMMLVHLGFCFEPWEIATDIKFPAAIVRNEIVIRVLIALRWVLQAIIYYLFGKAILKHDQSQMITLAVCAISLPIIRGFLLGFSWVNYMWDIICWILTLYWIGWIKLFRKNRINLLMEIPMFIIGFVCIFIRSYYGSAKADSFLDFLSVYSFVVQDMIRSFAMIFFGLWLLSLPRIDYSSN